MNQTRRLAAILAADVAGYSRLIGADEGGTLQAMKAIRAELSDPTIAAHNGRLVKTTALGSTWAISWSRTVTSSAIGNLGPQRLYLRSIGPVSRPANMDGYRIAIGATKR
jgi:hypothetical protein